MTNIEKIKQAGAGCKEGTLEAGVVEMLVSIADTSATAAEIIAQDLLVKELNIASAAKHLTDHAYKHRNGNSYYMTPDCCGIFIKSQTSGKRSSKASRRTMELLTCWISFEAAL